MEPGALHTFTPYEGAPLAPAIEAALAVATEEPDPHVQRPSRAASRRRAWWTATSACTGPPPAAEPPRAGRSPRP